MVYLDAEFADLISPALLSFSMVPLDGAEIYAEFDVARDSIGQGRLRASSEFARETVIPQFGRIPNAACSVGELGNRAGEWLIARAAEAGGKLTVGYDYNYDFGLLRDVMAEANIWDQVRPLLVPRNIDSIAGLTEGKLAAEASWLESSLFRELDRHHALSDALALRAAWRAACGPLGILNR